MSRTNVKPRRHGSSSAKRKRDVADETDEPTTKKKSTTNRPDQIDYEASIAMMDPAITADHFAKALRRHANDSTSIELEDRYLPSRFIRDTTSSTPPRIATQLPSFLEQFSAGKKELSSCDGVASPHTIVISPSGIRAADLTRQLRCFGTQESKIAKLFAKHMKLNETIEFVGKTKIGIGIGTPSRLKDLIEQGALKVASLKRIIIDGSYTDEKKRTIFDMKEVFLPLMQLLNLQEVKSRLETEDNTAEVLVF